MTPNLRYKLWLLRPMNVDGYEFPVGDNPWKPWYDKAFGFVVRAETEEDARKWAHEEAGDENRGEFMRGKTANTTTPWLDPKYSTCVELSGDGPLGVVMRDFASA